MWWILVDILLWQKYEEARQKRVYSTCTVGNSLNNPDLQFPEVSFSGTGNHSENTKKLHNNL